MKKKKTAGNIGRPGKRSLIVIGIIIAVLLAALLAVKLIKGDQTVDFKTLKDSKVPKEITTQIVPEYRDLERAMACMVGDKVYVLVSRGEKPTSGFSVTIDKMILENKKDKSVLVVYADFKDPKKGVALSQVITYPLQIARTDLTKLPEEVELRIQYE